MGPDFLLRPPVSNMKKVSENSLTYLGEALPIKGRALSLRCSFYTSLIDSLKYLLEACEEVIPPLHFSKATQNLVSINPTSKLSGLLSLIHVGLLSAIEQQDLERIKQIGERLAEDNYYIQAPTLLNLSDIPYYYRPLVETKFGFDYPVEVNFRPVSSKEFTHASNAIQMGIQCYKEVAPDFFEEFQELVSEILILHGQRTRAGSSFDIFSMIYIRCFDKEDEKITNVLDLITHEQSHLYVYLLQKDDPLVLNPNERYEAPLRPEKRPLIGIYHAVFVLSRIQYVLRKALASQAIPKAEASYCEETVDYYRKRFQAGFEILKKHAQMTPLAEGLIASASKLL